MPTADKAPISLIILTYNEEDNIEHTLKSVHDWIGEIIIIDSFSSDRTLDICRQYTDRIYQHPFENQAKQFNWAIDNVPIAYPWVMRLDSDEMVTPELAQELRQVLPTLPDDVTGIDLRRRVYFMGRWIKHAIIPCGSFASTAKEKAAMKKSPRSISSSPKAVPFA